MSGVQPVTLPSFHKVIITCMWVSCEGGVGCTMAVPCQQHWHRVHAISAGVHNSGVSEIMHPAHALTSKICPLKQTNMQWWSHVRGPGIVQLVCIKNGAVLGSWQAHISRCRSHSKYAQYATRRKTFPRPDFCYEMSIVCSMMPCYVLESFLSVEAVGQISSGPRRKICEISDKADSTIIQGCIR
jgi:hypothetical protein